MAPITKPITNRVRLLRPPAVGLLFDLLRPVLQPLQPPLGLGLGLLRAAGAAAALLVGGRSIDDRRAELLQLLALLDVLADHLALDDPEPGAGHDVQVQPA